MARRDESNEEEYEEKPRRRPSREESVQPAKPRRPAREVEEDEEEERPRRRRPREEEDEEERRPAKRRRPRDDDDYDDDDRPRKGRGIETIIPYHNGMALASYYCSFGGLIAIFGTLAWFAFTAPNPNRTLYASLMVIGGLLAAISVIFGIIGLIKSRRNRKARGTAHAIIGLLLGGCEGGAVVVLMVLKPFLAVAGFN
jgi:hypothetical protein